MLGGGALFGSNLFAQQQQQNALAAMLGGIGQGIAQHPLGLQNIKTELWPQHKVVGYTKDEIPIGQTSFFDELRNEIDEWLKL